MTGPHVSNLTLSSFGRHGTVIAGPYELRKKGWPEAFGIKLAPEVPDPADRFIPVEDFGTPTDVVPFVRAAEDAVVRVLRGEKVYVGCYFGQGRTGTFLSIMAKLCGEKDPILYVRRYYNPRAVETKSQERLVNDLPIFFSRLRIRFRLLFNL